MLSLALPRALVISTLTLAVTLATESARADSPEPPAAAAAPTALAPTALAAPPPASPPLGYANADEPPDVEYPPEMRIRSSGLLAGGVLLVSFGLIGVVAGSSMIGAHEPTQDENDIPPCFDDTGSGCGVPLGPTAIVYKPGMRTAGIATLVGSVVAMGAGIPLLVLGAKKVPVLDDDAAKAAKLTPTLRVGSSGATLTWQF
jgi:hypothetical protein